eukprot:TRINITY_DN13334_c0_g1_i1.p1 TRINITY_DN13334_c0_g1~~TRINITY_DN13334_c0_g1_i1.p1  ORF type:complete len:187 (+),score=45.01 TRINITY_DN13334_c0_g1_i1:75-635(+)
MFKLAFLLVCMTVLVLSEPLLLVKKSFGTPDIAPILNNDVTFSITVYNVGNEDALDVILEDELPYQFTLTSGFTSASWARLAPGQNYTHSYVAQPGLAGGIPTRLAIVTYSDEDGEEHSTTSSSGGKYIRVYDWKQVDRRDGAHIREWMIFVILSAMSIAIPVAVFFYIEVNFNNGLPREEKRKTD